MRRGGFRVVPAGVALVVLAAGLVAPVIAQSAFVTVPDQNVDMTAEVVVDDASLPEGGFLALYRGEDRTGELIGHTDHLAPGQYRDIAVPFDDPFYYTDPDTTHTVVVYRDRDGDESFAEEGAAAADSFVIGSIVTPTAAPETDSPTASPDAGGPAGGDTAGGSATATPGAGGGASQLTADEPGGSPPVWLILVGVLGVAAVGAGLHRRKGGGWFDTGGAPSDGSGDGHGRDTGPADADELTNTAMDETEVERLLESNGGRMRESHVVDETGWSSARVSQILDSMEEDGRVEKLRIGRETLVRFPDESPGSDGDPTDRPANGDDTPSEPATAGAAAEAGFDPDAAPGPDDDRGTDGDTGDAPAATGAPDWRESVPRSAPGAPVRSVDHHDLDICEFVGGGGSADVHRATVETADGSVPLAVKRPRARGTLHTEQVERFVAEAETWAKLDDHDGIVDVVGWGSEPLPWLAMEYMDGGHLGERAGDVDLAEGLWTAVSIAKAVRHAHRRGVAHLDLKPANVLFRTTDDGWDAPKVADWGLSKQLLEHSASVEGMTPHYAAPEQFDDGHGAADDITDVYGLGAVCYELFTGRPPFEGRPTEVMNAVLHETPAPPSEVADVPPALDEVLLRALATGRADRYESVLYLRDDLQEILDGL
jgi:hypothetical protein